MSDRLGRYRFVFHRVRQYSFYMLVDCEQYARGSGVLFALFIFCRFEVVFATPRAIFRRSFFGAGGFCLSDRLGRYSFVFRRLRQYGFYILVDYEQYARGSGVLFALSVFLFRPFGKV